MFYITEKFKKRYPTDFKWPMPGGSSEVWVEMFHSWSIFTMYWPQIALYALIGKE